LLQQPNVLSTKRLVAAAKFLFEATKKSFVVPNFVAVTKPFFSLRITNIIKYALRQWFEFDSTRSGGK